MWSLPLFQPPIGQVAEAEGSFNPESRGAISAHPIDTPHSLPHALSLYFAEPKMVTSLFLSKISWHCRKHTSQQTYITICQDQFWRGLSLVWISYAGCGARQRECLQCWTEGQDCPFFLMKEVEEMKLRFCSEKSGPVSVMWGFSQPPKFSLLWNIKA